MDEEKYEDMYCFCRIMLSGRLQDGDCLRKWILRVPADDGITEQEFTDILKTVFSDMVDDAARINRFLTIHNPNNMML